jgi:hypothetical protein
MRDKGCVGRRLSMFLRRRGNGERKSPGEGESWSTNRLVSEADLNFARLVCEAILTRPRRFLGDTNT